MASQASQQTSPTCSTQKSSALCIVIGNVDPADNEIPRWKPGLYIPYTVDRSSFLSAFTDAQTNNAVFVFKQAVKQWNDSRIGITFDYVEKETDAVFTLVYGDKNDDVFAQAFMPNNQDLNQIKVYSAALKPEYSMWLEWVFLHELGHVLGLRHEFALDSETGGVRFPKEEKKDGQAENTPTAPMSIMDYYRRPKSATQHSIPGVQPNLMDHPKGQLPLKDIEETKRFYALASGSTYLGRPIIDYEPQKATRHQPKGIRDAAQKAEEESDRKKEKAERARAHLQKYGKDKKES